MTTSKIIEIVENANFEKLLTKAFGKKKAKTMMYGTKKGNYQSDMVNYALMVNVETDNIFILNYAENGNGWAKIAESQNPWICIGYVSACDIQSGLAKDYIIDMLESKECN